MPPQQFVGLKMPVFTAFGWAGEEQALTFALSQLEIFINRLHAQLPRDIQTRFPFSGIDRKSRTVFLAASQETEQEAYIAFFARPMSLEMQFAITDKMALSKAWKAAEKDPGRWQQLLHDLGEGWTLHIPQHQLDEDSGETTFYQDIYKDNAHTISLDRAMEVIAESSFRNSEATWVVPFQVSYRITSEKASAMGPKIFAVVTDWLRLLMPLTDFLARRDPLPTSKKPKKKRSTTRPATPAPALDLPPSIEHFSYVARLRPLHIRRGFVNLTPEHWPFFATSARATTRKVTVAYDDQINRDCSVWRLAHNDQARVVLSPPVQEWLEDTFDPDDKVQVTALKLDDDKIEVRLDIAY